MLETILTVVLMALVPAIAVYVAHQALKLNATIDGLPGVIHQLLVVVEAAAATFLSGLLGFQFPADLLGGLGDPVIAQGGLTALFAWLLHKIFHPTPKAVVRR